MRDLASYPISFPYGATTSPYTPAHPHRGDDRAAPINTPIIIQGVTIGYVGMTGLADGYHCHNQEWQGINTNVRKPQNAFKGGTVIEVDSVGNTGDGSFGKYVTLRNDDGWNTSYCHMNTTNAKVGDVITQGGQPVSDEPVDETAVKQAYNSGLLRDATQQEVDFRINAKQSLKDMQSDILASDEHKAIIDKVNSVGSAYTPYVGQPLFVKKG